MMIRTSLTLAHIHTHIHTFPWTNRHTPIPIHIPPLPLTGTTPSTIPEDPHRLMYIFTPTLFLKLCLLTPIPARRLSHNLVPIRILTPHPTHTTHIITPHPSPIPIPTPPPRGLKKTSTPFSPTCTNAYQTWGGCLMVLWDRLGFR